MSRYRRRPRLDLRSAVVVVTGASRGIGRATAEDLARRGARVVGVARDGAALAELDARTSGRSIVSDVGDPAHAEQVVEHAFRTYGRLDALVANAGAGYVGDVADMPPGDLARLLDVNMRGPLLLSRAALNAMRKNAPDAAGLRGALVFITSIAGAVGVPGESVYSAAKAGVETFAEALGDEVRAAAIRVSTVVPGVVATELLSSRARPYDRRFPRPIRPDVVASAVATALETGKPRTFVPAWLGVPARLHGAAPGLYRVLARRFG